MKALDRFLQDYRLRMARPYIKPGVRVLDIGAFDQATWKNLPEIKSYTGIDPNLTTAQLSPTVKLVRGYFPDDLPPAEQGKEKGEEKFDLILMLAVMEHIPLTQWPTLAEQCHARLAAGGRVVITIPSPAVDNILVLLKTLRVIDGMDIEGHQHVEPQKTVPPVFEQKFRRVIHRRFQLGLNHLFVYERP